MMLKSSSMNLEIPLTRSTVGDEPIPRSVFTSGVLEPGGRVRTLRRFHATLARELISSQSRAVILLASECCDNRLHVRKRIETLNHLPCQAFLNQISRQ
jgi:hypothetical protein